jgi:hypothetical protein
MLRDGWRKTFSASRLAATSFLLVACACDIIKELIRKTPVGRSCEAKGRS